MDTAAVHAHSDEVIETRLELRDGAVWLAGLCPRCWEHFAITMPQRGARVKCPNGHTLRVASLRSEGQLH